MNYIKIIKGDLKIIKERVTNELINLGKKFQTVTKTTIRQTLKITLDAEKVKINYNLMSVDYLTINVNCDLL